MTDKEYAIFSAVGVAKLFRILFSVPLIVFLALRIKFKTHSSNYFSPHQTNNLLAFPQIRPVPSRTGQAHSFSPPSLSMSDQSPGGIQASQVKALEVDLKEAVALLQAEREANAEAVARLKAEAVARFDAERAAKEAVARLDAERKTNAEAVARLNAEKEEAAAHLDAERKAKDEAVRKLTTVVAEINSDATLQACLRNPGNGLALY